jgi:hypothetical protein
MSERSAGDLPNDLRAFLFSCIDSIEQVETLALLARSSRQWTARAVGAQLGLPDGGARHHLEALVARGLLQIAVGPEAMYSYGPKAELQGYADRLVEYYARDRMTVMRAIATAPRHLKRFAEAFKLRETD